MYEIDSFGFCLGYITRKWMLMSEMDMEQDEEMKKRVEQTKYEIWKRRNIDDLLRRYRPEKDGDFEQFCFDSYRFLNYPRNSRSNPEE